MLKVVSFVTLTLLDYVINLLFNLVNFNSSILSALTHLTSNSMRAFI